MSEERVFEIINTEQLRKLEYTKEDAKRYDVVKCFGTMYRQPTEGHWKVAMAKLVFPCKDKLVVELRFNRREYSQSELHTTAFGPPCEYIDGVFFVTPFVAERWLNHLGFVVESSTRMSDSKEFSIVVARRMPRIVWDGERWPHNYDEHTIVEMPLTFQHWQEKWFPRWERTGRMTEPRVEQLIREFTIWKFQPIWWCKNCSRLHQGTHRLMVSKRLGFETIDVRVMRCWWKGFDPGPDGYQGFDWSKEKD